MILVAAGVALVGGLASLFALNAVWAIPNNDTGGAIGIAFGVVWVAIGFVVAAWFDS